jgi:hypothetical protein
MRTTASRRKQEQIAAEAALDGVYVLRTSVPGAELEAPDVVRADKQLEEVERAFRTFKGRLELRAIHHRLEQRVKAHVFLCMLSYYLAWHLRRAWKPLLFDDEQPPTQPDPVARASRSTAAKRKTQTKRTTAGEPCHSLAISAHRALDPRLKHDPPAGHRRQLRAAHTPHSHPGPRARADRRPPTRRVVTTDAAPTPNETPSDSRTGLRSGGELRASWHSGLARSERMTPFAYQNARSVPGSILLTRKLRKKKPK